MLTCYVYGADGARLKKITTSTTVGCADQTRTGADVTLYAGIEEIRNWKGGIAEHIFVTPLPNIRLAFTTPNSQAFDWTAIHHDAQGSVRGVTSSAGTKAERTIYRPYGNADSNFTWYWGTAGSTPESRSSIGERLDAAAGLQYLNARYYDPRLGLFIQPDWFEVTEPGVGTNRYGYAGGDPVNGSNPGGNYSWDEFKRDASNFFSGALAGASNSADFDKTTQGALGGIAVGSFVGGTIGTGAACYASVCAGSVVATPGGAFVGAGLGGFIGGVGGLAFDAGETLYGGIAAGIDAVAAGQQGDQAQKQAAGQLILARLLGLTSDGSGAHGNILMSPSPNELYYCPPSAPMGQFSVIA